MCEPPGQETLVLDGSAQFTDSQFEFEQDVLKTSLWETSISFTLLSYFEDC
jgi:hypothetical protein